LGKVFAIHFKFFEVHPRLSAIHRISIVQSVHFIYSVDIAPTTGKPIMSTQKLSKLQSISLLTLAGLSAATLVTLAFLSPKPQAAVPSVIISAQKMTVEQKIAYDMEQFHPQMQTVVISAKAMTLAEKAASDQQARQKPQNTVKLRKIPAILA
jgi:hypothetical protein